MTGVTSGNPPQIGALTLIRTTVMATLSHYRPGLFAADHQWKVGTQIEKGEHDQPAIIPGGVRFIDDNGRPFQAISSAPSNSGGQFITAAAFASDALTIGERLTINAGVRFDHSRAISQDLRATDVAGRETGGIIHGLGTLYTWNVVSPRLGVTERLTADGRTILRASYGRFNQGVLTGEIAPSHPGVTPITTTQFDAATGGYTQPVSVVDPKINLSGKPWAATTQMALPQGDQRILLEPRGSRRLSSQSILDVRVSRTIPFRGSGCIELLLDVLNALNDTAEEALATDNLFSPNFSQPSVFMDPRRAMLSVRLNLGR